MTTIATDGLGVAADGRLMRNDIIVSNSREKAQRLPDGSLLGCAGDSVDVEAFVKWLASGGKRPKPSDKFSALHLTQDGLFYYSETGDGIPCDPPFAIGSGCEVAMGAMDAGATPQEAVELASERDPFTGGKIVCLELEAPPG